MEIKPLEDCIQDVWVLVDKIKSDKDRMDMKASLRRIMVSAMLGERSLHKQHKKPTRKYQRIINLWSDGEISFDDELARVDFDGDLVDSRLIEWEGDE